MKRVIDQVLTRKNLVQLRESRGFTQKNVAILLKGSRTYYNQMENGYRPLTPKKLKRLAKIYNLDLDQICVYEDNEFTISNEEYSKLESCIYHSIESNLRCIIEAFNQLKEISPHGINNNAKEHLLKIHGYIENIIDIDNK